MLLKQAIDLFLGEHKATTRKTYAASLTIMQGYIGPARPLADIQPAHLIEFFQKVIYSKDYAPATIQKHTKTIKTFFNWCVRVDLLVKSPALPIRGRKLPRNISRDKAMSDAELAAIIEAVRWDKPRDFALILFLADTGCRRGGAAGLTLKDLDFHKLRATVTEKGEKSRLVAFSPLCALAIQRWLANRQAHYTIRGVHVFSTDGSPMKPENVSLIIRRAAHAAGVRVLSSHSLRHRKGHQLADSRIAPSIAATVLGHSDVTITLQHYYPADWESAEQAMRELLTDPAALADDPKIRKLFG